MTRVMWFGMKGKLSPQYVGPYMVLRRVRSIVYKLEFPSSLSSFYPVLNVLILMKLVGDPSQIKPIKDIGISNSRSYGEVHVEILDRQVC